MIINQPMINTLYFYFDFQDITDRVDNVDIINFSNESNQTFNGEGSIFFGWDK